MPLIATNRRAFFDYDILTKYEAGLVLSGQETKSVKTGHMSIKGSFVTIKGRELYLTNALIPLYRHAGNVKNYDPTQPRKILLKKAEIKHIFGRVPVAGLTLVPLRVYTKRRYVKLEFGIGRGRKKHDKRAAISKRETKRRIQRVLKN